MSDNKGSISILVASEQYLSRLGIRTILSVIGVEGNIAEYNSAYDIISSKADDTFDYRIVSSSIYEVLMKHSQGEEYGDKLLLIDESQTAITTSKYVVNANDERTDVLTKFQDFFSNTASDTNEYSESKNILSDREVEVLKLVAKGYINKEISDELYISINTVITHRKNITEKLSIKTISGLTVYAMLNGYITAEDVKKE
ncbi:MAG: response regulator transcription factor [Bacteroidales bacterium]